MAMVRRIVWTPASVLYNRITDACMKLRDKGEHQKAGLVWQRFFDWYWSFANARPWEGIVEYRQETDRRKWYGDLNSGN